MREMRKMVGSNGYMTHSQFSRGMSKLYIVMWVMFFAAVIYRVLR